MFDNWENPIIHLLLLHKKHQGLRIDRLLDKKVVRVGYLFGVLWQLDFQEFCILIFGL